MAKITYSKEKVILTISHSDINPSTSFDGIISTAFDNATLSNNIKEAVVNINNCVFSPRTVGDIYEVLKYLHNIRHIISNGRYLFIPTLNQQLRKLTVNINNSVFTAGNFNHYSFAISPVCQAYGIEELEINLNRITAIAKEDELKEFSIVIAPLIVFHEIPEHFRPIKLTIRVKDSVFTQAGLNMHRIMTRGAILYNTQDTYFDYNIIIDGCAFIGDECMSGPSITTQIGKHNSNTKISITNTRFLGFKYAFLDIDEIDKLSLENICIHIAQNFKSTSVLKFKDIGELYLRDILFTFDTAPPLLPNTTLREIIYVDEKVGKVLITGDIRSESKEIPIIRTPLDKTILLETSLSSRSQYLTVL